MSARFGSSDSTINGVRACVPYGRIIKQYEIGLMYPKCIGYGDERERRKQLTQREGIGCEKHVTL